MLDQRKQNYLELNTKRLSDKEYATARKKWLANPTQEMAPLLMRETCLRDLFFLNYHVLGYKEMDPELHRDLCDWAYKNRLKNYMAILPRGHFKALQTADSKVLTSTGWILYSDLGVGSEIITESGSPTKVTYVHSRTIMKIFEVTTDDGRIIRCNDEHLFKVKIRGNTDYYRVEPLRDIRKKWKSARLDKRTSKRHIEYRTRIKPIPVQGTKQGLLVDPYVLGAWLGDGTTVDGTITSADPEIFNGWPYEVVKRKSKYFYAVRGLRVDLRKIGVLGNKHIPEQYLRASFDQRLELLRGLMDTDGTIGQAELPYFANTNKLLVAQFVELVRSLGGIARITGPVKTIKKDAFYISVRLPHNCFRLKRKVKRFVPLKRELAIKIVSIKSLGTKEGNCITVADPSGMFVAGDYFPTHNSTMLSMGQTIQDIILNPEVTILICNIKHEGSKKFLHEIKGHFETNDTLRELFPDIIPSDPKYSEKWTNEAITVLRGRPKAAATIETAGTDSKTVGSHYDIQIYDDIIDDSSVRTKEQIEATWKWYDLSLYLLNPKGRIRIIGTRYHFDDFYSQILHFYKQDINRQQFAVKTRRALEGVNTKRYVNFVLTEHENAEFVETVNKEEIWQDKPIFPNVWTKKELKRFRIKSETNFWNQMMNFPIDPEEQTFQRHFARFWTTIPSGSWRYITMDPSVGISDRSDMTAIIDIRASWEKKWYLQDVIYDRLDEKRIIEALFDMYFRDTQEPRAIGIESEGFQKNLKNAFEEECRKRHLYIPIVELNTHGRSKDSRIRALQYFYENEYIYFTRDMRKILESEVFRYPNAPYKDFLDALAYMLDLTQDWGYPPVPQVIEHSWRKAYDERQKARMASDGFYEEQDSGIIMRG